MADQSETADNLGGAAGGPANPPEPSPAGLWVRATINLPGRLYRDHIAYVNPADPVVADALALLWLVPLPGQEPY